MILDPTVFEEYERTKVSKGDCANHGNLTIALLPQLNQVCFRKLFCIFRARGLR